MPEGGRERGVGHGEDSLFLFCYPVSLLFLFPSIYIYSFLMFFCLFFYYISNPISTLVMYACFISPLSFRLSFLLSRSLSLVLIHQFLSYHSVFLGEKQKKWRRRRKIKSTCLYQLLITKSTLINTNYPTLGDSDQLLPDSINSYANQMSLNIDTIHIIPSYTSLLRYIK